MVNSALKWALANPAFAIALIAGTFALIGGFLAVVIWPLVSAGLRNAWDWAAELLHGRTFENKYLEWVIREHQFLPILPTTLVPVTEGHHHELDRLYVALTVSEGSEEVVATQAFEKIPQLVILGDPGAGKTTMLRFLALTFARARRNKALGRSKSDRKDDAHRVREARRRVRDEYGFSNYPIPIFVYLNRLRDVADWDKGRSILDALRDEWKAVDTLRAFPETFFADRLKRGQCIFLFDAYDELGSQEARDAIARHIGELATATSSNNRFITTSRIVGYSGQLAQYGFRVLTVQRLSWALISELVTKWYEALDEPALSQSLLETLEANPRINELAANPMLLSLIVLVQYVKRIIPDRRDLLYDECVRILVERRFAPPAVQNMFNKTLSAPDAISILQKIARALHDERLREISRDELENKVIKRILSAMPKNPASKLPAGEIVRNIENRSQMLVERGLNEEGKPVLAFSHMTFQEYLTAVDLRQASMAKGHGAIGAILLEKYEADPQWWEEVALLYAAQLDLADQEEFFRQLYPTG